MDSFYDAPRQPPVPTTINKIGRIPVVPEVSVVENSFFAHPKTFNPFDSTIRPPFDKTPKDSLLTNNKKHVRFKYPNFGTNSLNNKENCQQPLKTVPDLNGKTFKQIYMANVPDRHLDLSVFEPPTKEPELEPLVYREETKPSQTLTKFDRFSYRDWRESSTLKSIENRALEPPRDSLHATNTPPIAQPIGNEIAKPSDEPTIKDLFKIIQQQNEQIMLLQRQVNNLKNSIRQPEPDPLPFDNSNSPTKKGLFSIDFQATSVEVSFRPPTGKFRKQNDFHEPKIQEILECDNSKDNQDLSLNLEESLHVKDSYMSAVPSIQINMDEYHSSDDEESVNIGVTFYKDLMDQVNNVLKKMQVQSECQKASKSTHTMTAVKQATLQHLKSIGVNLTPIQETNEITGGSEFSNPSDPSEISFAVKQLLMKYLPDDKLTKAINKPKEPIIEKKKMKTAGSEFSFATLQYLKKYNLIDNSKKLPEFEKKKDSPKILDVTALKRQPKLL